MATHDSFKNKHTGLAAPATNISSWTVDDIKKSDILVFRESATEYINTVVAPNGLQVGLLDNSFRTDLLVTGHITGSGIVYSELGFSGSLTKLIDGSSYLVAGSGMTITTQSNGSILLASSGGASGSRVKTEYIGTTVSQGSPFTTTGIKFADYSYDFHKIDVFYNGELIKSGSSANLSAGTCDYTLGTDTGSGGQITYSFAINSSDVITIICGSGSGGGGGGSTYSAGTGLSLTGTQFAVKKDGTTVGTDGSGQLEVLKTPGTLTAGNGINSATFDGATNRTISIKPVASSPIIVSSAGVGMDITSQTGVTLAGTDELLVYNGSAFGKTTAQAIANLASGGSGAPTNAQYLVLANDSNLSHERALVLGNGLTNSDGGANSSYTVSVLTNNAGGLEFVSGKLAVKVGDFVGTGLTNNSGNIDIDASAIAGSGLSGSGSTLSVNFGSGANQAALGSNTVTINAGDGLSSGGSFTIGTTTSAINLDVASTDLKGRGLSVTSNNLEVYLAAGSGIAISTGSVDSNGEPLQLDVSGLAISNFANATVQTSTELGSNAVNFANNDTSLLTAAGIKAYIDGKGFGAGSGTVTSVGITSGNLIDASGGPITASGNIQIDVDLSELATSTSNGDGDYFVVVDSSNGQKKLTKANINISEFNNDAGYLTSATTGDILSVVAGTGLSGGGLSGDVTLNVSGITISEIAANSITLSTESFADNDTTLMTSAAIDDLITSKGFATSTGDITSVIAGSGLKTGGTTGDVTVDINYDGSSDSLIKDAYDGTGVTVDISSDLLVLHDATDNKVKYINPSQIAGSIGAAEEGSYTDGLFTDFTSSTSVGTAIDRFNEVLKGLAPAAAPGLDDIDCDDSGSSAKLSFGNSQSISGYTNARPSTLSSPSNNLSDIDINSSYSSTATSNDLRIACFGAITTINGTLNEDIPADGTNYAADSFGDGNQGTLKLFVNDNTTPKHTTDLSSFGSGNSLNSNSSGFNLSASTPGHFADGSNFATFQHRQGTYVITAADQRNGWNYARVVHTIGGTDRTCNYVTWVNDPTGAGVAMSSSGSALNGLSMTGTKNLSGVKYHTGGTANYAITIANAYRNVYSTSQITFGGSNTSVPAQNIPSINHSGGEDETKSIALSGLTATINSNSILNGSISVNTNVPHPLKSNLSGVGTQSISGILLYSRSDTASATSEPFRGESYRMKNAAYNAQADVSVSNTWDSTDSLASVDGLLFYNQKLVAPKQGANSGNFSGIANGPSGNVDYSGITSGTRTFFRKYQNNSGGSKTNFNLTINGSGTIVASGGTLNSSNIKVFCKLPNNSSFSTGWMDLAVAFSTGQVGDNDGCLVGSLDSSLNATNEVTFGTQSVGASEYIIIKVLADASWTGNISQMNISWL